MTNRAPLIVAIVLLLLPVLYVGSYFALVEHVPIRAMYQGHEVTVFVSGYRGCGPYAVLFFWPLEQIDRTVRPGAWG
ncbi:hypothetical protein ETAA8_61320 [Anatilimnocola aggregata]|uniref:Uncharacterized protein n=1 Tax=Anatilimnocola aggregata TaxID=2528021 RepID=A0A517YL80_9BACT|nr:hypothetical protein [Anatilimnocola aggregata]QDU30979.1 hypothetical protein ETAA8_61320 [Anatilimnocola aggregata]